MRQIDSINFQKFFLTLLNFLSEREQEVLKKRYQLTTDLNDTCTLKEIGDFYGITRERVRQIEKEAIGKIKEASVERYQESLNKVKSDLIIYIEKKGGVVVQDDLIREHVLVNYDFDILHLNSYLFTVENLIDDVKRSHENDDFYTFWHVNHFDYDKIEDFVKRVIQKIDVHQKLLSDDELFKMIETEVINEADKEYIDLVIKKHENLNYSDFINSILTITKKIERNIFNNWGLTHWVEVKPKKLSDKINLVFKYKNKPLHFREITEYINQANFSEKNICAATVHNELIANDNFVLIGRGIYAPKEWGYMSGTVSDIITNILRQSARPLSREEIYNQVLKQRKVNQSTIYLALINKSKFEKLDNGLFKLK